MDVNELRKQLNQKLETRPLHRSPEDVRKSHQSYIDYHMATKPDNIYVIPMEEMAELADVQICIDNLRLACGVDPATFEYIKDIKFERATRRIGNHTA